LDANLFIEQAIEGLRTSTSAHAATWHFGEEEDWAADMETGLIQFTFSNGTIAEANLQVIGTYNSNDETFLWGWDHPSVPEPLSLHANLARQFGEQNQLPQYTQRKINCTPEDAWVFTAVAARLGNANGAYRGPAGSALVYMTFGKITLRKL
jgi:hypothetical protein